MDRNRRSFLASVGAVAVGGCVGNGTDPAPTTGTSSSGTRSTTAGGTTTESTGSTDARTTTDSEETTTSREPSETTIGFAGDAMVGRTLNGIYGERDVDPASIWGDFQPRLQSLDGVFCNLECCLSTHTEKSPGRAYYFRGDPEWAVPALDAGNVRFTALANNHAMDFGSVALTDTIDVLDGASIENAGTGRTPAAAWAPASFTVGDLDVAVISFSDEYGADAATDDRPGIAWARTQPDSSRIRRVVGNAIERAKSRDPDLLVVSVHWGENWIEVPGDRLVSFGHWLVDQGVDLVHGHSAHVVQGIEQYGDGVVLHDTGDLVDDFGVKGDLGNDRSFLFEVTLGGGEVDEIRLVPFHIDHGVRRATEEEAAWLRETFRERAELFDTAYERAGDGLVVRL